MFIYRFSIVSIFPNSEYYIIFLYVIFSLHLIRYKSCHLLSMYRNNDFSPT